MMKINLPFLTLILLPVLATANGSNVYDTEPSSALTFQQTTNSRIVVEENHLRFYTSNTEQMQVGPNGEILLANFLDIGTQRPADAFEGGVFIDNPGDTRTSIQLATKQWSGSHALLFNAYKSAQQIDAGLVGVGNTKFTSNAGSNGSGAGMIHFGANAGKIEFYISDESSGASSDVNWGTSKMSINRRGKVGIGITNPESLLHIHTSEQNTDFNLTNDYGTKGRNRIIMSISDRMWQIENDGNNNIFKIRDVDASADRFCIDYAGEVGIGTTNPSKGLLHVYKNATTGGWGNLTTSNAGIRVQDSGASLFIDGNSLYTNSSMNIGTIGSSTMTLGTNNTERVRINANGNVSIGTTSSSYKLHVAGDVRATKFRADGNTWADFVFDDNYDLNELEKVEEYIEKNHHLPEIPSAADVAANGIDIVDMQAKLLQKIEELTLYVIDQNKDIRRLQEENKIIKKQLKQR